MPCTSQITLNHSIGMTAVVLGWGVSFPPPPLPFVNIAVTLDEFHSQVIERLNFDSVGFLELLVTEVRDQRIMAEIAYAYCLWRHTFYIFYCDPAEFVFVKAYLQTCIT